LGLLGVVSLPVSGCRSEGRAQPDPKAAPSASVAEDPNVKKKIGAAECAAWADNGVGVAIAGFKAAVKDCPVEAKDAFAAQLDSSRAELRANALATCSKHVGEEYVAKDGSCYLKAKTIAELAACNFSPMRDPNDTDLLTAAKTVGKSCGRVAGP
jgi:hypothetical protein